LHDLLRELKELGNPVYPNRAWHVALQLVAREDFFRHVSDINRAANPAPVLVVSYIPDPNPRALILNGCIRLAAQVHEEQKDRERRLARNYKQRYRKLLRLQQQAYLSEHREKINAQRRKAYRRNRAERSEQAHDYYLRNRERLKAKARELRKKRANEQVECHVARGTPEFTTQ
jgi:hypothetical protein